MHKINRKLVAAILVMLLVVVSVETYAFSYVNLGNLQLVVSKDAMKFPPYVNESYTFASNGAKWLILIQIVSQPIGGATGISLIYIFKTSQNMSLGVFNLNIVPQNIEVSATPDNMGFGQPTASFNSPDSGGNFYRNVDNKCTFVNFYYDIGPGVFNVDYAFNFRVYETTLVGIIPLNQETIHLNGTITIP